MGTQLPLPKPWCTAAPQFSAHVLWPNGWTDQDATWTEVGLGPGDIVLDGDPAHPASNGSDLLASLGQLSGGQTNFAGRLAVSWAGTLYLGVSFPLTEFCHVQNALCVQVLHSPVLPALLHGTLAVGISQRRGRRNGIMELSQRAPPIFGRAASMSPHSSLWFDY